MELDLSAVPFSCCGSYAAFSILPAAGSWAGGLYLRSVHGGAQQSSPNGRVALVEVIEPGQASAAPGLAYEVRAQPARLDLVTARGTLSLCMAEPFAIRVRGEGVGLRLTFDAARGDFGDYAIPAPDGRWRVNSLAMQLQWMLSPLEGGSWRGQSPWTGVGAEKLVVELLPEEADGARGGACEGVIEEYLSTWHPRVFERTFAQAVHAVQAEFDLWLKSTPGLPARYAKARALAAYVTWASIVEPQGCFLRPAMYMSKNWMTNVWAWDHCFNAMALVYHKPLAAWDQFMTLFDQQDEYGALPDSVNDRTTVWNFCKPPIHGWALGWMMHRSKFFRADQLRQVYGPLCRWTEWWFETRDDDQDGIPQYHHGNDSGWDNATPFAAGVPLESPDLCAFLVLQMETLAVLARRLNDPEEAESWNRRAGELQEKLLAHFWQGDHFVALRSGDHLVSDSESLFLYLPLVLGRRLPPAVLTELVAGLARPGRFLTPYGLATESPRSPDYVSDGYWRGPIWAPSTLLIVEGLAAAGEHDLAVDIARRFCDLFARSGCAENFDALTGAPLRDLAYTWTASAFLVLGHEYLGEEDY